MSSNIKLASGLQPLHPQECEAFKALLFTSNWLEELSLRSLTEFKETFQVMYQEWVSSHNADTPEERERASWYYFELQGFIDEFKDHPEDFFQNLTLLLKKFAEHYGHGRLYRNTKTIEFPNITVPPGERWTYSLAFNKMVLWQYDFDNHHPFDPNLFEPMVTEA